MRDPCSKLLPHIVDLHIPIVLWGARSTRSPGPATSRLRPVGPQLGGLEDVLGELYDHHVSLGTNTSASPRLVPTGADLWGEVVGERAVITSVRRGTAAERAGLRAGMVVTAIGGRAIAEAIAARRPAISGRGDAEAASWAFRVLLAGTHDKPRRLTACAAIHRAVVVGMRMAGLRGGIAGVALPHSGITVRFQNERLFHIDGTPRERWVPPVVVEPAGGEPTDPILERGIRALDIE
jgi:hypothetical protein